MFVDYAGHTASVVDRTTGASVRGGTLKPGFNPN